MEKFEEKKNNDGVEAVGLLLAMFFQAAVFLWMMPTIASLLPALTPLCALGYWQWLGLLLIVRWIINSLARIVHK